MLSIGVFLVKRREIAIKRRIFESNSVKLLSIGVFFLSKGVKITINRRFLHKRRKNDINRRIFLFRIAVNRLIFLVKRRRIAINRRIFSSKGVKLLLIAVFFKSKGVKLLSIGVFFSQKS